MNPQDLVNLAVAAAENAYAPYSNYRVGAALWMEDGRVFTGCNVENASYGLTNCAERTAVFKAVSEGAVKIRMIAIAGGRGDAPAFPCGACRQVMAEFADAATPVLVAAPDRPEAFQTLTLGGLLPYSFKL
ncbi:MAG: cytidine deaminase [Kiritimatiellia bacterium]